ncbi:MAG: hypothetical protein Q9181_004551 [Wetmoreana brouardii]
MRTMRRQRSQSLRQPQLHPSFVERRPRADTDSFRTSNLPVYVPTSAPAAHDHLPFSFGAEFELIICPRHGKVPDSDADHGVFNRFGRDLPKELAGILSASGMRAEYYDPAEEKTIDYDHWNVMLDGSVSRKYRRDGFYPVEIVTPVIRATPDWVSLIDRFWSVLNQYYECLRDTTCGFHVHISPVTKSYSDDQIRQLAKAIVFWGPATAECAPPSRQDNVQDFCKSNFDADDPTTGSLRGHGDVFQYIDNASRDEVIKFVCPDKYRAWNLLPSKFRGSGSIEFRRAPGVETAKKAKHWIAFTMAFIEMAMQFNPNDLARYAQSNPVLHDLTFQHFESTLLDCARQIDVYVQLDPRLRQPDNPRTLHITTMQKDRIRILQQLDKDHHKSVRY